MGTYTLTTIGPSSALLDLPIDQPLELWDDPRIVHVPRGLSRHVVRFVRLDGRVLAVKQAPDRAVLREHRLLRELDARNVPVVEAFGVVVDRRDESGEPLPGLLITAHLSFSTPYRMLFAGRWLPHVRDRLLDALAELLVRLHLAGFAWGDCSLSNALFRRDAGALAAYLVDAETGELHARLSDGQRGWDLDIAVENIAGELLDLRAAGVLSDEIDPLGAAEDLRDRYLGLWAELNRDDVVDVRDAHLIDARVRRLNALGYDVSEIEISAQDNGSRLRFGTHVVDPGHHQRTFLALTGLRVQENQARRLLADLARFRATWADEAGMSAERLPEDLAARRWLDEQFYCVLSQVPAPLRAKLPDAELYHEILEHRWFLSERTGHDVGRAAAIASYIATVLATLPPARVQVLSDPPTEEIPVVRDP